jgi:hypothetical protein
VRIFANSFGERGDEVAIEATRNRHAIVLLL